jgi:DsbC/DsbD-like thiol-disulfide interchange protein
MQSVLAFALVLATTAPLCAGQTPWQEVAPGVSMRLVSTGEVDADGTTLIGIEVEMPENTKTYWRVPGETGIPTQLDFAGSNGIVGHQVLWPYPKRDETEDYLDYAYYGPTLLPVAVKVEGEAPSIALSVVMGVCSDICIPAQARFSLPVDDDTPDRPNGLRIRQAEAMAPIAWDGDPAAIGRVEFRPEENALAVWLADPEIEAQSLIAATESGEPLFGTPQKSPEPNLVLIPLLGKPGHKRLESHSVQLTFTTAMGAFEVTRPIEGQAD